jgi:hypothetical protein
LAWPPVRVELNNSPFLICDKMADQVSVFKVNKIAYFSSLRTVLFQQ